MIGDIAVEPAPATTLKFDHVSNLSGLGAAKTSGFNKKVPPRGGQSSVTKKVPRAHLMVGVGRSFPS
jgi:hypothetical protein